MNRNSAMDSLKVAIWNRQVGFMYQVAGTVLSAVLLLMSGLALWLQALEIWLVFLVLGFLKAYSTIYIFKVPQTGEGLTRSRLLISRVITLLGVAWFFFVIYVIAVSLFKIL